jgi:hypothetical protein
MERKIKAEEIQIQIRLWFSGVKLCQKRFKLDFVCMSHLCCTYFQLHSTKK